MVRSETHTKAQHYCIEAKPANIKAPLPAACSRERVGRRLKASQHRHDINTANIILLINYTRLSFFVTGVKLYKCSCVTFWESKSRRCCGTFKSATRSRQGGKCFQKNFPESSPAAPPPKHLHKKLKKVYFESLKWGSLKLEPLGRLRREHSARNHHNHIRHQI